MRNAVKIIICTIISLLATLFVLYYQRNLIIEIQGATAVKDPFIMSVFIWVIVAMAIFIVLDTLYIIYCTSRLDSLTGVLNASSITNKGGFMHATGKLKGYTMLFLNIKDCKYLNNTIGNKNCDLLLKFYAKKLHQFLRGKGYIGRMGGDNFLVIVKSSYLEELLGYLSIQEFCIKGVNQNQPIRVNTRAGIVDAKDALEYRNLISNCSTAMLVAKKRNEAFVFYDQEMQERYIHNKMILENGKAALGTGEFVTYLQPKVDAKTRELCGAEALVRWFHDNQMISPGEFIPAFENDSIILDLDYEMFENVCKLLKKWRDKQMKLVCVSVNFSKHHLEKEDFVERLIKIREQYEVPSEYLEVELTESTGCDDYELLQRVVAKIKKAGFRISIDDFGTGYSSLSMLQKFEANVVKLDKSFLDSAFDGNDKHEQFLCDIIQLVKDQGEETLCEGVETIDQLQFLQGAGCDIIQGYYFDRPMPADAFEQRLISSSYAM